MLRNDGNDIDVSGSKAGRKFSENCQSRDCPGLGGDFPGNHGKNQSIWTLYSAATGMFTYRDVDATGMLTVYWMYTAFGGS